MMKSFYVGVGALVLASHMAHADIAGEKITVFGPWLSPEIDVINDVFDIFEAQTGAEVSYVGSDSFEAQIQIDTEAGTAPNIAIFPQPGLAADLAARGHLTPLRPQVADWVRKNYAAGQSWVDLASYQDPAGETQHYGMFFRVDLKSLVWFSPDNFEDAGYDIPKTMEELKALSDQIVADGGTPWCIGLGSGAATGWPATDWIEDILLRQQPPEIYDQWVTNAIRFDDPMILQAIDEFGTFSRNDSYVSGGVPAVAATDFRDSPRGLFTAPPQCYLHRQASFAPVFFPDWVKLGVDADFFYFPTYEQADLGTPVLGSGTLFAITKESEGAHELIAFLQSPEAHELWMSKGGFLTPHMGVNSDKFADDVSRKMNNVLLSATTFRFDASDLMPGAVGAGSFWTGMIDYVGGQSAKDVAAMIQSSWEALK